MFNSSSYTHAELVPINHDTSQLNEQGSHMYRFAKICLPIGLLLAAGTAPAQLPNLGGGLGGLAGQALPSVASVGVGNAAGVLGYCVKQKLLGTATNATSVLGRLAGQPNVTTSPGYAAGQGGVLQNGTSNFSLSSISNSLKAQLCNQVLRRATSFL